MHNFSKNPFSLFSLIIANLLPLFFVFRGTASLFIILLLYWSENIVIGLYAIPKIILAQKGVGGLLFIPIFLFHFSIFSFIHFAFLSTVFSSYDTSSPIALLTDPFVTGTFMSAWIIIAGFFVSHGISFFTNFIGKQEFRSTNSTQEMFAPYKRIGLMQLGLFVGALPIFIAAHSETFEKYLIIFLIFIKLALDLYTYRKTHVSRQDKLQSISSA